MTEIERERRGGGETGSYKLSQGLLPAEPHPGVVVDPPLENGTSRVSIKLRMRSPHHHNPQEMLSTRVDIRTLLIPPDTGLPKTKDAL